MSINLINFRIQLDSEHRGPQRLRRHALHDPICIKSDDESVGRQVSVDGVVDLQPEIVVLRPPVTHDGLAVEARHFQTVGEVGNAILVVGELGWEEAEAAVCGEEVVGQEVNSVADPVRHGDAGAVVYRQCDRGVGLPRFERASEGSTGLLLRCGICGLVL